MDPQEGTVRHNTGTPNYCYILWDYITVWLVELGNKKYFLVTFNNSEIRFATLKSDCKVSLFLFCFVGLFPPPPSSTCFSTRTGYNHLHSKKPIEIAQTTSTASRPISIKKPCNLSDLRKQGKKLMK